MKKQWIAMGLMACAVAAWNVKTALNAEHSDDLLQTSLTAIGEGENDSESGGIIGWWNRNDYDCIEVICWVGGVIPQDSNVAKYAGAGLGTVPHTWNCTGCGDWGYTVK